MRYLQGVYLKGYVTVLVTGNQPELFFQACIDKQILVWNVRKNSEQTCFGSVKIEDIARLKELRRGTGYKITFTEKKGFPFILKQIAKRKEIVFSLIISLLLIICLSNILWKVNVIGVSTEIEGKIRDQLEQDGIYPGSWSFTLKSPSEIQKKLTEDIPELLWVGVHKNGTTFYLEGIEKTRVKQEDVPGPRNLVATKKGVIKSIFVSEGLPKVQVNDYVKPGDVLVSGVLSDDDEGADEEDEREPLKQKIVAAEAEITAQTWYETSVTIPLSTEYELLTGNQTKRRFFTIGNVSLPIFGFKKPKYEDVQVEKNRNSLYFFKWKLPFHLDESILSEKVYNKMERTKEEAINVGIRQAKQALQLQLGPEAKIISEKVLHETIENGKVNIHLYITVQENIIKAEAISQGD